jgi:diguanylate cyclase (GGDEF)-like protein/PAS domain S-box-containing protein
MNISQDSIFAVGGRHLSVDALLRQAIESAGEAILITDRNNLVVWANLAFAKLCGFGPEELLGGNCRFLLGEADSDGTQDHSICAGGLQGLSRRELVRMDREGKVFVTEETVTPLLDQTGAVTHFVSVLHDVTQSAETLRKERLRSRQDPLTGLASRAHLLELLHVSIESGRQLKEKVALLFIDLDGFKNINDANGHHTGDAVLQAVGSRIQAAVRSSDTVSRYGGDEFLILLPRIDEFSIAVRIAQGVLDQLAQPISIESARYQLTASIGIAFFPDHGLASTALLINSDTAMYAAKKAGGDQIWVAGADGEPRRIVRS